MAQDTLVEPGLSTQSTCQTLWMGGDLEVTPEDSEAQQVGWAFPMAMECSFTAWTDLQSHEYKYVPLEQVVLPWLRVSSVIASFSPFLLCSTWLLIQGQNMLKVSFILINHHMFVKIVVCPCPDIQVFWMPLVICWLLWLALHVWQSNMLFHVGASSWVLVGFLIKMWVQTIALWYSLNRGNLEVYSYHEEYAEMSARSLWPSLCWKGLAFVHVFTWLPVETRTVLLSPPQWISCWFCLCRVC